MKLLRILVLTIVVWSLLPLSGASAKQGRGGHDQRIVISGPVVVTKGETVDGVMVLHGSAKIDGRVNGDVVILDGPIDVAGTVNGDLVAFKGPVTLREGAKITGDVKHGGKLNRAPGASVAGETSGADFRAFPGRSALSGRIAAWIGFTVSIVAVGALMMLLGPRATDSLAEAGLSRAAPALGWGLVALIGIPVAAIASFLTLVGIPLGFMLIFGLVFLIPVSYATTAFVAGRKLVANPARRFVSFLAGLAVLRLLAMLPFLGGLTWFLATAFGLGVIAVTVVRARTLPAAPADSAAPAAAAS